MNPEFRNSITFDWMTLILVFSLLLLVLSKHFFKASLATFLILPFNTKYLALNKKKGRSFNWFHVLLTLFQLLNIALFIFVAANVLRGDSLGAHPMLFWIIVLAVMGFILLKIGLQLGNGYFFENQKIMNDLIFEKLTYFNYGGIIAFFGNIILIYIAQASKPVVYVILILILFINLIGIVTILKNHQKLIIGNILYFILYLCTLEISPLVIVGSYLKD